MQMLRKLLIATLPLALSLIATHAKSETWKAVDFRSPDFGTPLAICQALESRLTELGIGQMIFEYTWVHISTRAPVNPVNVVLTLAGTGYVEGIVG